MRRLKLILAVVAAVGMLMVSAIPAMADSEMSSSGGDNVIESTGGDVDVSGGDIELDGSGGVTEVG